MTTTQVSERAVDVGARAAWVAQRWLNSLPRTVGGIVSQFEAEGLHGVPGIPSACPVACGLRRALYAAGINATPWVSRYDIAVDNYEQLKDRTKYWTVNLMIPEAVSEFVHQFDRHRFPQLFPGTPR